MQDVAVLSGLAIDGPGHAGWGKMVLIIPPLEA